MSASKRQKLYYRQLCVKCIVLFFIASWIVSCFYWWIHETDYRAGSNQFFRTRGRRRPCGGDLDLSTSTLNLCPCKDDFTNRGETKSSRPTESLFNSAMETNTQDQHLWDRRVIKVIVFSRLEQIEEVDEDLDSGDCFTFETEKANEKYPIFLSPDEIEERFVDANFYCIPRAIIIGVQKAGTGEMRRWLGHHPQMMAWQGERHYFDRAHSPTVSKGIAIARWLFADRLRSTHSGRLGGLRTFVVKGANVGRKWTFEKTPAYFDVADPAEIRRVAPSVRLILMLRDPSEQLFSSFFHSCPTCTLLDFASVLQRRMCLVVGDSGDSSSSISDSHVVRLVEEEKSWFSGKRTTPWELRFLSSNFFYAENAERWRREFPAEQFDVIRTEDFQDDPFRVMHTLEAFLGLAHHDYRSIAKRDPKSGYWYVEDTSKILAEKPKPQKHPAIISTLDAFFARTGARLAVLFPS